MYSRTLLPLSFLALSLTVFSSSADAGVIVQPSNVSTSMGSLGSFVDIGLIIDQSGLSQTYTSGIDDFDTYIGLNPIHERQNNTWASETNNITGVITFDLGSIITITRLGWWDAGNFVEDIQAFEVYSDNDSDFNNGGTTFLGNFNPTVTNDNPSSVQVFDFTDAMSQFIHINVTQGGAGGNFTVLGEVAFEEEVNIPPTPEPHSLISFVFFGVGLWLLQDLSVKIDQ